MAYGESSVSENGVESLKIVEHAFLVITALDTNAARVEEVIWKMDGWQLETAQRKWKWLFVNGCGSKSCYLQEQNF